MTFDPAKPVQTRDGRPARIVCTDTKSGNPILALVTLKDGQEVPMQFSTNGQTYKREEGAFDLINIPETRTLYVHAYHDNAVGVFQTREHADYRAVPGRIARVKVTYTEGQFDE